MGLSRQEYWSGVPLPSKYAYLTLYAHAAIWKERQLKTATGEPMKHFRETERLLTAMLLLLLSRVSRVRLCATP